MPVRCYPAEAFIRAVMVAFLLQFLRRVIQMQAVTLESLLLRFLRAPIQTSSHTKRQSSIVVDDRSRLC